VTCPHCGRDLRPGLRFCPSCGQAVAPASPVPSRPSSCPNCGRPARPGYAFCAGCGQPVGAAVPPPKPLPRSGSQPLVAALLSLVVPGCGQAGYGHILKGFLILLGSPLLIPWIYGCIDAYRETRRGAAGEIRAGFVGLHLWLYFNALLLVAIVLTMTGVLR